VKPGVGVVVVLLSLLGTNFLHGGESEGLHSESVEVNGIRLHYRIGGSGPPLLLLHGFSGSGTWWDPLVAEFAESHTTIVPDLPGHGRSEGREGPYRYRDAASDLFGLLDHLGIENVRGMGYSAGGEVLLHMAIDRPERIETMALVAAAHTLPDEAVAALKEFPTFEENPPAYREYWLQNHPGGEPQVRSLLAAMRGLADVPENMVGEEQLGRITAPTLLVVGDRDPFVPLEVVLRTFRALPQAELWVVPGQEHSAVWPDWGGSQAAGEIFPGVVIGFLQGATGEHRGELSESPKGETR
jgi:pimeloyl-ACP methyl ester carboxylesterase